MIKKLLLSLTLLGFISISAPAQSFHAELSYQTFRPFINFSIEIGNGYHYQRSNYQTAYLKGYMDGVNQTYYNAYRFYDLVYNIEAYETGYRDGLRDQALFYRLRGYSAHYHYQAFSYEDYYSPYYSVQIWLNQLSFTFIKAPVHRLPHNWSHRLHPSVKYYRARVHNQRGYYVRFESQYQNYNKRLKSQARYRQQRYRNQAPQYGRNRTSQKLDRQQARERVRGKANRSNVQNRSRTERLRGFRNGIPNRSTQVERRTRSRSRYSLERPKQRQEINRNSSKSKTRIRGQRSKTGPKVQTKRGQNGTVKSGSSRNRVERGNSRSRQKVDRKSGEKKVRSRSGSNRGKVKSRSRSGGGKSKGKRGGSSRKRGGNR